jgi:hypothetical protein
VEEGKEGHGETCGGYNASLHPKTVLSDSYREAVSFK